MTNKEEALRMALDALEETRNALAWFYDSYPHDVTAKGNELLPHVENVLAAIREVLEQSEQEPVAWRYNGKLHEFDPSDWATGPVTPLYTSPPAKPWVNPSLKEYEDIMLANITPRTNDERDGIMCALNDMVVLLKEKNT